MVSMARVTECCDGGRRRVDVDGGPLALSVLPTIWILRRELGCDEGQWRGVHRAGGSVGDENPALTKVAVVGKGRRIVTIEDWRRRAPLHPMQQAFLDARRPCSAATAFRG